MAREENNHSDNLKEWRNIKIHGTEYIISTLTTEDSWKISLTNLVEIWIDTITKDIALERCQSLNLLLDLDSFNVKGTLDKMLSDIPKHATDKTVNEIKLETLIGGITFKFNINLKKGTPLQFWNEITKPLCQSSVELQRRHKILIDLIERKDEEITEYKLTGAQLIRKNIETVCYSEEIFKDKTTSDRSKSDDCINAFQSMIKVQTESKNYKSINNSQHSVGESSDQNPVDPGRRIKLENPEASETTETVNNNEATEVQIRMKAELTVEDLPICENESMVSGTSNVEQIGVVGTKLGSNESKVDLSVNKIRKKRSTPRSIALPPVQTGQSKKPKKDEKTRSIYDIIA